MNSSLRFAPLALALCLPAAAQGLSLDKIGGALAGTAEFPIAGTASDPYLLLISGVEKSTSIPSLGITLAIADDLVAASFTLPGFLGTLDANGKAQPSLAIPNLPALEGIVLSFQAISGSGPYKVSNLVRITPQASGTFKPALNQPSVPIIGGSAAQLADGKLIFVGGSGPVAQRYNSRIEEWELSGASFGVGLFSQTTALDDGRLLFTGGLALNGQPTDKAAIYDPATQKTLVLTMATPRAGHGASLMKNGKVLVTGGFKSVSLNDPLAFFAAIQSSSEIYDPTTDTFSNGTVMLEARAFHSSSTLSDGSVMIAGGLTLLPVVNLPTVSPTAYRYNPSSGSFGFPALMNGARFLHSAVGLSNGRVLLSGGLSLDLTKFLTSLQIQDIVIGTRDDCQLYKPGLFGFGSFKTVPGMQEGRAGAAIAALPNGGALIAGGFSLTIDVPTATFVATATETADIFSQSPSVIVPTGSMAAPRLFPQTVNLPDDTVMVLGGGPAGVEIFQR